MTLMFSGQKQTAGFTIVELLIVVVVIAILAAITIVSYNGITQRAFVSTVQTEFRNTIQAFERYKAETGSFPATNTNTELAAANVRINTDNYSSDSSNFLYCANNTTGLVGLAAVGKNGVLYAQSNQRSFGVYTTTDISSYGAICNDLTGSSGARYGRSATETPRWRVWINP